MNQKHISESANKVLNKRKEYYLADDCFIYLLETLPEHLSIGNIINGIKSSIPAHLLYGLDAVYIGGYKELDERNVDSVYYSGAIYVRPNQKSDDDLISDIIHEIAHSVEENHSHYFMTTGLQTEFLNKRKQLYKILNSHNIKCDLRVFMNPNYSDEFDNFLYKDVGYQTIDSLAYNVFISPYAATSLREYFANGFEHYFYKCKVNMIPATEVFQYCPRLLSLLKELTE